jgi:urocanate hydratase
VRRHRFTEAYLRPLFDQAIGPFRWISLTNGETDIRRIDDYPLVDATAMCASQADLDAIHSGGGYSEYMTSAGLTVIADGTCEGDERLTLSMTNDTSLGVMRCADAGYSESFEAIRRGGVRDFLL